MINASKAGNLFPGLFFKRSGIRLLSLLPFLLLAASCATHSSAPRVFFVEQGRQQYFFPACRWTNSEKSLFMDADWLYRDFALPEESEKRTVLNFSLMSASKEYSVLHNSAPRSLVLSDKTQNLSVPCSEPEVLFADTKVIRYSCWVDSEGFASFMRSAENPLIQMEFSSGETAHFVPVNNNFGEHLSYFRLVIRP